jgi:hypothetical protein
MKIRPWGADHVDGRTDMMKLTVACRNFAKAPNKHYNNPFIHLVVCLTTGPEPLPKRALHIVRSRASAFK